VNLTVSYAYTLRQSDRSNGGDHYVTHEPLNVGRLHRQPGDALCKPHRKFWGLEPTRRDVATCKRCLEIAARLGAKS
jgi:hypothetical protein